MKKIILIFLLTSLPVALLFSNNKNSENIEKDKEINTQNIKKETNKKTISEQENKKTNIIKNEIFTGQLSETDEVLKLIVYSDTLSREEKISEIYSLIENYPPESFEFRYLVDVISDLKPLKLSSEFIDLYQITENDKSKQKIIRLLSESTTITAEIDDSKLEEYTDDFVRVKDFFESEIKNKYVSTDVINSLVFNYNNLINTEDYIDFIENELANINHSIDDERLSKVKLSQAMSAESPDYLKKLLSTSDVSLSRTVYSYTQSMSKHSLSAEKTQAIKLYLDKTKQAVFGKHEQDNYDKINWIESASLVSDKSKEDLVVNIINSSNNVAERAFLASYYPDAQLSNESLSTLKDDIESELGVVQDEALRQNLQTVLENINHRLAN